MAVAFFTSLFSHKPASPSVSDPYEIDKTLRENISKVLKKINEKYSPEEPTLGKSGLNSRIYFDYAHSRYENFHGNLDLPLVGIEEVTVKEYRACGLSETISQFLKDNNISIFKTSTYDLLFMTEENNLFWSDMSQERQEMLVLSAIKVAILVIKEYQGLFDRGQCGKVNFQIINLVSQDSAEARLALMFSPTAPIESNDWGRDYVGEFNKLFPDVV